MGSTLNMILWEREGGLDSPLVCLGATVYMGAIMNTQSNFKPPVTIPNFLNYNPRELAS